MQSRSDATGDGPAWAPSFSPADVDRFEELLRKDLDRRQLSFSGSLPTLTDASGREFFVGNLAQSCASAPPGQWRTIIRQFLDSFSSIDGFISIGPDVARMSLRLRLFDLTGTPAVHSSTAVDSSTALNIMRSTVHWPALPGLHWLLYVRRGGAGQNVLPEHLDSWGISTDEAWTLAKKHSLRHDAGTFTAYDDMAGYFGDSMFTHAAVLECDRWKSNSANGQFISAPTRHQVLARTVDADGVKLLSNFFQLTADVHADGPYRLSTTVWWAPPTGVGEHGREAEPIRLVPDGINEDGETTFALQPGPQLQAVLDGLL